MQCSVKHGYGAVRLMIFICNEFLTILHPVVGVSFVNRLSEHRQRHPRSPMFMLLL